MTWDSAGWPVICSTKSSKRRGLIRRPLSEVSIKIDFHSIQRWKARKGTIDGVSIETTYKNTFVRQILSQ
jgi:hypothetical protein